MGQSSSDTMKIQQAPLMSDLQLKALDSYLTAALQQMQGFNLGVPYGGPSTQSYTPRTFGMPEMNPTYGLNPWDKGRRGEGGGDRGGGGGDGGGGDGGGGDGRDGRDGRDGGRKRAGIGGTGGKTMGGSSWVSPWTSIFNNLPKANVPASSPDQQLIQMLTSPFARPYNYGMTGNFPKR